MLSLIVYLLCINVFFARIVMGDPIKCSLEVTSTQLETTVHLTLENTASYDIQILKRGTPMGGVRTDCLDIQRDGQHIAYDGFVYNLVEEPLEEEYEDIVAGGSLFYSYDIGNAYSGVTRKGNYTISVKSQLKYWQKSDITRRGQRGEPLVQSLSYSTFRFRVAVDGAPPRITEERAPHNFTFDKSTRSTTSAPQLPMPPSFVFNKFNNAQKATITDAHNAAALFVWSAINVLAYYSGYDQQYYNYFGAYDYTRYQTVYNNYNIIRSAYTSTTVTYDFGFNCKPETIAYTNSGNSGGIIYLCSRFFDDNAVPFAAAKGKYASLIHEMSHCWLQTADFVYGITQAKEFAANNATFAYKNADNYGYFGAMSYPFDWAMDSYARLPNGYLYATLSTIYVRFDDNAGTVSAGYPRPISGFWGSCPFVKFDCLAVIGSKTYAFYGNQFVAFSDSNANTMDAGYPKAIAGYWGNIPTAFNDGFDSMALLPNGKIYATKGNMYIRYSDGKGFQGTVDANGYISDFHSSYNDKFDAIGVRGGYIYIWHGYQYIRYSDSSMNTVDAGYPINMPTNWGRLPYYA